jgi:glucokinase
VLAWAEARAFVGEVAVTDHSEEFLLGDIGGTNARFALSADGRAGPVQDFAVANFPHIIGAIREFLKQRPGAKPRGGVLAGAGPVYANRIALTNSPWVIDGAELGAALDLPFVQVINDFEALAWSLPALEPSDLYDIGGGTVMKDAPAVVLGPGTGLGVGCLAHGPQGPEVIVSEGGHATLAGGSRREDALIDHLRSRFGHVSAERALSGGGLVNLYEAVAAVDGLEVPKRSPADVSREGVSGTCATSRAALELFCGFLGTFAGDAALMFGARGGVYLAGGIVPRFLDFLKASQFRKRFDSKGRLSKYVGAVPTHVITHKDPAFVGLAYLAGELARRSTN